MMYGFITSPNIKGSIDGVETYHIPQEKEVQDLAGCGEVVDGIFQWTGYIIP
jgi:hypothetical protein